MKQYRTYWVVVALDYDLEEGYILYKSDGIDEFQILDGYATSDNFEWSKQCDLDPGLYKLTIRPWSKQYYDGDYDSGIDVVNTELLVKFPKITKNTVDMVKPHLYIPDAMAMGDCQVCGHAPDSHVHELKTHNGKK